MRAVAWARTDVGRRRERNEDSVLADESRGLFAVADGMGGHRAGARASELAVEVLAREVARCADLERAAAAILRDDPFVDDSAITGRHEALDLTPPPATTEATRFRGDPRGSGPAPALATVLRAAARASGRAIYDEAQDDRALSGMGTTLTALLIRDDRAAVAHVGDSRAFLFRDGRALQLTDDHSWIAEQVRAGLLSEDEARESRLRHIITRSVGFERDVEVDLLWLPVRAGDCFLLCSDGMSNHVETPELARVLEHTYFSRAPQLLVDLANDRGGEDNVSVVVVYVANELDAVARDPVARLMG